MEEGKVIKTGGKKRLYNILYPQSLFLLPMNDEIRFQDHGAKHNPSSKGFRKIKN